MMRLTWRTDGLAGAFLLLMSLLAALSASTFVLPLLAIGAVAAGKIVPAFDPRRASDPAFHAAAAGAASVLVGGLFVLQLFELAGLLGHQADRRMLVHLMVGTGVIVAGNYLPKLQSNWFVGVRTPWTLTSEAAWQRTHRLAGWLLMAGGVAILTMAFVQPTVVRGTMFAVICGTALVATIYSYWVWRSDPQRLAGEQTR